MDAVNRRAIIGKIHMAKDRARVCPECGRIHFSDSCPACKVDGQSSMDDSRYRQFLTDLTGVDSCTKMAERELQKVADAFDRAGYSVAYPFMSPTRELRLQKARMKRLILKRAPLVLGYKWQSRIQAMLTKMGKPSLDFCDFTDLRKLLGWLNRTEKYQGE